MNSAFQTPEAFLDKLHPEKQEILRTFLSNTKGISSSEMLPLLMETQKKMQESNLSFTKEETAFLLTQIEHSSMSPSEQMAFQLIKQMLSSQT